MLMPYLRMLATNKVIQRVRHFLHDRSMAMHLVRAVVLLCGVLLHVGAHAADNTIYASAGTTIYALNPATGAVTSTGTLSFATNAIGRDPNTGRVYYVETAAPFRIAYFDPITTNNTILPGQLGFTSNRATFDSNGTFWVMDPANGNLFTINTTTGAPTFFGTVSGVPNGLGGDIAFSPSGQLYVVANTTLYAVTGLSATGIATGVPAAIPGLAFINGGSLVGASGTDLYTLGLNGGSTLIGATGVTISDLGAYPKFADMAITKTAGSTIFTRGTNATYTLAVRNNGPQSASGPFTVTDTLPAGLTFVSGTGAGWTCSAAGQNVTCTNNTASLTNGASLANIILTVAVGAGAPNSVTNSATIASTTFDNNSANNTSTITTSIGAPTIAKSFNPAVVATSAPSTLTLTITNSTATGLTGVSFNDPFPANLVIATPANLTNTCGGTITGGAAGNTSIGLNNGTLAGNASCSITVAVTSSVVGSYSNTTTGVSSTQTGGAGAPSNTAVLDTARPVVVKSFLPSSIGPGTTSTLSITLSNTANVALTGAAFTDTFPTTPAAMTAATPLTTTNTCGGTLQNNAGGALAAGAAGIRLTGGTIPASGSCTITIQVTANTAGDYTNTIAAGAVTTTNGGSNIAATSAILSIPRPGISKFFSPSAISTNSPSTLTITLTNSSATAYTGAAFTDTYPAGINTTATPGVTNTCGGTVTAAASGTSTALTGGTIPANGSCQITVQVTSATAGTGTNTIAAGALTTANGGSNASATAATLVASAAADLQLTKTHSGNFIVGANASYTLTVNNTAGSAATSGTITVTDTLPAGLTFVSGTGTGWACSAAGQNVTCTSSTVINAGTTSPNPITLTAAVAAAAVPSVSNTATVSGGGETNNTNNNATDVATVIDRPTIIKSFNPVSIGNGQSSLITLTLTNPNATVITGATFTDTYPANLVNTATPGAATTCGGAVTAAANGGSVALTGGTIPANGSCTVTVNVTSTVSGSYTNTIPIGGLTTANAGSNAAASSATLQVLNRPTLTKSFTPGSTQAGGTSVLTLTLTNSNTTAISGADFTDTYPAGLTNTATPTGATTCAGGTVTAAANGANVALTGGTIPANASCTVTVNVTAAASGSYANTIPVGGLTTTNAGSNAAAASATYNALNQPAVAKSFSPNPGSINGVSVLTITLSNSNTTAITGAAFTDTYPAGLTNTATPAGATSCAGGTATALSLGTNVALSGATIPASGSCTVTVNVTAAATGSYANTIPAGAVTSANAGSNATAGSATYTVLASPTVAKAFSPNPVGVNGASVLTLTITNPNASTALTGVALPDTYPSGLTNTSTPSPATTCTGATLSGGTALGNSIGITGGTVAAGSSCTITVNVTSAIAGSYNNTTGNVSSTNAGTGGNASATLVVINKPTIAKSFTPAIIGAGGTSTFTLTISNSSASALTGFAFTDSFPAGLVVAATPALTNSCNGTISGGAAGNNNIGLSGGSVAAAGSCTITVAVTAAAAGSFANTASGVSSNESGSAGPASNTATLTTLNAITVAKAFSPSSIGTGNASLLTITLSNGNATAVTGTAFTDTYPAGVTNTAAPAGATTCAGGTVIAASNGGSVSLAGATIPANGACTVTVNVTSATAGNYVNSIPAGGVTTTNGGSNAAAATANLAVLNQPTIAKAFAPSAVGAGGRSLLSITLSNSNGTAITGADFTDTYPAGLTNSATPGAATTCGGTVTANANGSAVVLSGGTIPANGFCTVSVNVTASTAGSYANTIPAGALTTANAGANTAAANATLTTLNGLTVAKAFGPTSIGVNGTSVLTITLTNGNSTAVTGAAFTDVYPSGLVNTTTPAGTTTCTSGTVTAANGGASAALSGGTVPASGSCTVTVNVTSATAGSYNNSTGPVTTTNAGTATAGTATLTVLAPPAISKVFSPTSISTGAVSTLTFTLTNSNATALTGTAFSDVYPAGLVNASTPNVNNTCGGSTTGGTPGANSVGLTGGTIPANGSCTVKVDVTSNTGGAYNNISGAVSSTNGGTGNTASATLSVLGKPSISKTFTPTSIVSGGSSTLTLTITNNGATPLTGVVFTDTFPAGLTIASTPALNNTCAGIISGGAAGNNFLDLTNGNVAANGFCSISVAVTASAAGTYNNTASGVSSNETGTPGASSNVAQLAVVGPPSIAKAFSPTVIGINGTSTLTFTLTNNNGVALTGVAFTDTYPANLVNAATPTVTSSCGGSTTGGSAGGNTIGLTGGTIPANSSCAVTVNVTSGTTGTYNNVSGTVTSTNGGTGNTASASLTVSANPTISKAFSPATIPAGGVSTVTFVLSNSAGVSALASSFTDNLPAGMVVASPPSATNGCLGTLNATAGNNVISLANGTIPGLGSCTITVSVTAAAAGAYPNTASAVSSLLGNGAPSNTATLTATAPATISKSFTPASILANGTSTLAFVINNPNSIALTGMAFTDNFPAGGLQVASAPNVTNNCGGTVNGATPGSTTVSLASGTLAAGASCTITLVVTSPIPGSFSNTTTGVSSNQTSTGAGANASLLTVVSPDLRLSKTHNGNFTIGVQGTYTLTIDNTLGTAATSGTITVTDTLPNGLTYVPAGSGGTGWTCSAAGQVVTCTSGTVIAAGTVSANPITINVSVAAIAVPSVTNSASVSGGGEPAANAGNNSAFDPTVVTAAAQNAFLTDGAQTALPGTTVFYTHRFNAGLSGTVAFSTSNVPDPAVGGWSNVIYRDANCNGILDGSEGNTALTGSIAVTPGDSICIIVKEFVPAGAPYNARDVITVTATFTPAAGPAVTYTHTDTTTVGNAAGAGLALQKTVRNVTTGGTAGTSNAARPGETLEYTITYTNNSADPLATIVVNDGTPAFTTFVSASCGAPLPANITACSVTTQPSVGSTGAISWTLTGSLASTQSGTVIFRVLLQ